MLFANFIYCCGNKNIKSMLKKNQSLDDFIYVISLVSRYYDGKGMIGKTENNIFKANENEFTSLFNLFF